MSRLFFQEEEDMDLIMLQNVVHLFSHSVESQLCNFSDECQGTATEYKHQARSEISG